MSFEIRPAKNNEDDSYMKVGSIAFRENPSGISQESDWRINNRNFQRTVCAFDGTKMVGVSYVFEHEIRIPGGSVPSAGLAGVGVLPTHRRKGALNGIMRKIIDDAKDRGDVLATLWASEASIYGRYGFSIGAFHDSYTLHRAYSALNSDLDPKGYVDFIEISDSMDLLPEVHDKVFHIRNGVIRRDESLWDDWVKKFQNFEQKDKTFLVGYWVDEKLEGYALYSLESRDLQNPGSEPRYIGGLLESSDPEEEHRMNILEMMSTNDEAYIALWKFLLGVDGVNSYRASKRPLDDPLIWLLEHPDRMRKSLTSMHWVRIVDVLSALKARKYSADDTLVIQIYDDFCPWNQLRVLLEVGSDGNNVSISTRSPDISLSTKEIASIFLGGVKLRTLAINGRVQENKTGAIDRLDLMFSTSQAPWCPEGF